LHKKVESSTHTEKLQMKAVKCHYTYYTGWPRTLAHFCKRYNSSNINQFSNFFHFQN